MCSTCDLARAGIPFHRDATSGSKAGNSNLLLAMAFNPGAPTVLCGIPFPVWTSSNLTDWAEHAGSAQLVTGYSGDTETVRVTLCTSLQVIP